MGYRAMNAGAMLAAAAQRKIVFNMHSVAFKQQSDFINDPARLKALFTTRRGAKSFTGGIYLVKEALENPGCNCLYIALTRFSAMSIVWKDILKVLDQRFKLNLRFNETLLQATFPNGSIISVAGADTDESEMNKLLGRKYKLVVLDEASMFTVNMHQLVYGILKPATADQRGTICIMGTASNITRGLFYDITCNREPGWSLHKWTAYDNPHVAIQWTEEIAEIEKARPLFKETSLFKQWYLNQWVIDEDAKVYRYDEQKNKALGLSREVLDFHYVLGIDLGHSPDPSAFVVSAYHDLDPTLYFIHAEKHLSMDVTDVANKIKQLDAIYNFDVKVCDNANKQAIAEMNNRHQVNVIPTPDKTQKEQFINLMNSDFIQKKIMLLPQAKELADEMETLVWMTDNGVLKLPRKEHPSLPNHLCFVAGTLIDTPAGERSIESLIKGALVNTSLGPKRVQRAGMTSKREILRLIFSNGAALDCTPDHPIWTQEKGFVRADALLYTQTCVTKENQPGQRPLPSKALNTKDGRMAQVHQTEDTFTVSTENHFIGWFTRVLTGLFLEDGTFIIKMGITSTIARTILRLCQRKNTAKSILNLIKRGAAQRNILSFWTEFAHSLKSGMRVQPDANGIGSMQRIGEKRIVKSSELRVACATSAIGEIQCLPGSGSFARQDVTPKTDSYQEKMTSPRRARGAKKTLGTTNTTKEKPALVHVVQKIPMPDALVYNLQIEDAHEYFANGILVSNCDAALYNWRYCFSYLFEKIKAIPNRDHQSVWETEHLAKLIEAEKRKADPFSLDIVHEEQIFDFNDDSGLGF